MALTVEESWLSYRRVLETFICPKTFGLTRGLNQSLVQWLPKGLFARAFSDPDMQFTTHHRLVSKLWTGAAVLTLHRCMVEHSEVADNFSDSQEIPDFYERGRSLQRSQQRTRFLLHCKNNPVCIFSALIFRVYFILCSHLFLDLASCFLPSSFSSHIFYACLTYCIRTTHWTLLYLYRIAPTSVIYISTSFPMM